MNKVLRVSFGAVALAASVSLFANAAWAGYTWNNGKWGLGTPCNFGQMLWCYTHGDQCRAGRGCSLELKKPPNTDGFALFKHPKNGSTAYIPVAKFEVGPSAAELKAKK